MKKRSLFLLPIPIRVRRINFDILITGSELPQGANFQITNTTGKLIHSEKFASTKWHSGINYLSIRIPEQIADGLYVYRLILANGKEERGQFVIKRQ